MDRTDDGKFTNVRAGNIPPAFVCQEPLRNMPTMSPQQRIETWQDFLVKMACAPTGEYFENVGDFFPICVDSLAEKSIALNALEQDALYDTLIKVMDVCDATGFEKAAGFVFTKNVRRLGLYAQLCPTRIDDFLELAQDLADGDDPFTHERLAQALPDIVDAILDHDEKLKQRMSIVDEIVDNLVLSDVDYTRKKVAKALSIIARKMPEHEAFCMERLGPLTRDPSPYVRGAAHESLRFISMGAALAH